MNRFAIKDGALQIFDVDHGQCALLTLPAPGRNRHILIDCGHSTNFRGEPWYPGAHLIAVGVSHVDLLICTNYDEDHASGLPDLLRRGITVGCILGNPTVSAQTITALKRRDGIGDGVQAVASYLGGSTRVSWGETALAAIPGLQVRWTWNPYPYFRDENNLSLVATLNIHGFRFLFPGDMECAGFENMLNTCTPFQQDIAGVDVLVASHHGRKNGIYPAMFDTYGCNPQVVVISDDYKQYETQETTGFYGGVSRGIADFRGQGARGVLTTRSDGEIKFTFDKGRCTAW